MSAQCLSFPPGIKEGSPLPGHSCDVGVLGAAAEAAPEVSGVGWKDRIQPSVVGSGWCVRITRDWAPPGWGRVTW